MNTTGVPMSGTDASVDATREPVGLTETGLTATGPAPPGDAASRRDDTAVEGRNGQGDR